nr:hypothetical protein [Propionicimonas sp.]
MPQKTSHRLRTVILVVWIVGFLIGTTTHVLDLVAGGLETYAEFPTALRLFWVSLTVIDPITAALLALRRRAGIVLALIVILADIAVNWTVFATVGGNPLFGVVNQTVFAAILLATAPILWRWFPTPSSAAADQQSSSQPI